MQFEKIQFTILDSQLFKIFEHFSEKLLKIMLKFFKNPFFRLLVNCITLCRLGHLYSQRENRFEVKKQVRRIHYLLLISIMSTLTVAIPNGISLVSAWFGRVSIK